MATSEKRRQKMETEKMDMSKREIEERSGEILGEMNILNDLMEKKRQTKTDKIEMRRRLNDCESSFRHLLFELTA